MMAVYCANGAAADQNGAGRVSQDGARRRGFEVPGVFGHGYMVDLPRPGESGVRMREPLGRYSRETSPEVEARLGAMRAHEVTKINLNVFPNASFTSRSNMLHVWQPRGPDKAEVWLYLFVDTDAPPEVKDAIRLTSQRHFSPAGMFDQDDMDNWELSTQGARGMIMRQYPHHYAEGLVHERWIEGGGAPRRLDTIKDEANQRVFYRGWANFMAGRSWDELRRAVPGTRR